LGAIFDFETWKNTYTNKAQCYPLIAQDELEEVEIQSLDKYFLKIDAVNCSIELIRKHPKAILILHTQYDNKTQIYRHFRTLLESNNILNPVILCYEENQTDVETFQLYVSSDAGNQFIDGFGDGIWIKGNQPTTLINSLAFGILQATRTRISKTEYISCPSCGRTLFDLQETTAKIRNKTSHLKGIKIGIMGCIVNGPGEMADADYGYVGTGPGKIHLYKEKEIVKKNIPESEAVDALIDLIKENGDWVENNQQEKE
jgi:(E)-4-hydroxy-3-methylbut-2-enyl-diphosphate synthase